MAQRVRARARGTILPQIPMLSVGFHHVKAFRPLGVSKLRYTSLQIRLNSSLLDGTPVTETNRQYHRFIIFSAPLLTFLAFTHLGAEATMKRFWKTVGIEDRKEGIAITLDKRALKTPSGHTLLLPHNKRLVATLIATEWENQRIVLKPHALPMVGLISLPMDCIGLKTLHRHL